MQWFPDVLRVFIAPTNTNWCNGINEQFSSLYDTFSHRLAILLIVWLFFLSFGSFTYCLALLLIVWLFYLLFGHWNEIGDVFGSRQDVRCEVLSRIINTHSHTHTHSHTLSLSRLLSLLTLVRSLPIFPIYVPFSQLSLSLSHTHTHTHTHAHAHTRTHTHTHLAQNTSKTNRGNKNSIETKTNFF